MSDNTKQPRPEEIIVNDAAGRTPPAAAVFNRGARTLEEIREATEARRGNFNSKR